MSVKDCVDKEEAPEEEDQEGEAADADGIPTQKTRIPHKCVRNENCEFSKFQTMSS